MPDVLIIGDTMRSPELRHEVPLAIPDALLYAEVGGKRCVVVSAFETGRVASLGTDLEVLAFEDAGSDELVRARPRPVRAGTGALAERLPALRRRSARRRRPHSRSATPTPARERHRARGRPALLRPAPAREDSFELDGIRRACRAVEAGQQVGVDMLRRVRAPALADDRTAAARRHERTRRRATWPSPAGSARRPRGAGANRPRARRALVR